MLMPRGSSSATTARQASTRTATPARPAPIAQRAAGPLPWVLGASQPSPRQQRQTTHATHAALLRLCDACLGDAYACGVRSRSNATCSFLCSAGTFSIVLGSFQESDCKACPEATTSVAGSSSCICQPGVTHYTCRLLLLASAVPALAAGRSAHIATACSNSAVRVEPKSLKMLARMSDGHLTCALCARVYTQGTPGRRARRALPAPTRSRPGARRAPHAPQTRARLWQRPRL